MAVVMVVQEEADEFGPEPQPEEVEDAWLRGTVGPKTARCGGVMRESCQGGVESRQRRGLGLPLQARE